MLQQQFSAPDAAEEQFFSERGAFGWARTAGAEQRALPGLAHPSLAHLPAVVLPGPKEMKTIQDCRWAELEQEDARLQVQGSVRYRLAPRKSAQSEKRSLHSARKRAAAMWRAW